MREAAQFVAHINAVRGRRVNIRLAEDNHAHVAVQIDAPRLGAEEAQVDKVAQPLGAPLFEVAVGALGGHVQCALPDEGLRIGRHVGEVVHNDEHLHHGAEWIKQGHLDRARLWHHVPFFA